MSARPERHGGLRRWAEFDAKRKFRFLLGREWDPSLPRVCFVGLNPSDANEKRDDTTATKYVGFAARNGFGSYEAINRVPLIETEPRKMYWARRVGFPDLVYEKDMDAWHCATARAQVIVVAWGNLSRMEFDDIAQMQVHDYLKSRGKPVLCLGLTKSGFPRHASRLGYDTPLVPYQACA